MKTLLAALALTVFVLTPGLAFAEEDINNARLTENVRNELIEDQFLRRSLADIQLKSTRDGTVYLKGTVDSPREKSAIERKVEAYPGVEQVDSAIRVRGNRVNTAL